jgi:transcriptional regulator with XRE-family HTH domain
MQATEFFSQRLKQLRGPKLSVAELARRTGVAESALYKAEGGELTVSWKTVEKAYGDLCLSAEIYQDLLMAWAMTQSERPVALYAAKEAMTRVMEDQAQTLTTEGLAMQQQMELLAPTDQRTLVEFARHFRRSENTRQMARIWLEGVRETAMDS